MSEETEKTTRPAWHHKEIGARLVVYAIETFGADIYEQLQEKMELNGADLEKVMKEVDFYYQRASLRCPDIDGLPVSQFAEALKGATFAAWSESAGQVRRGV